MTSEQEINEPRREQIRVVSEGPIKVIFGKGEVVMEVAGRCSLAAAIREPLLRKLHEEEAGIVSVDHCETEVVGLNRTIREMQRIIEEERAKSAKLQHELEVRTAQDGDTIRELRAQIRELEYQRDGGQGWVRT